MSEFQISPEGLRTHANHLGEVRDGVELAVEASGEASISDGSLGMMIGPLVVGGLWLAETAACAVIGAAGDSVDRLAEQVREVAADFESSDQAVGEDFSGVQDEIDTVPVAPGVSSQPAPNVNPRVSVNIFSRMGG